LEQFPDLHIVTIDHDVRYVPTVPAALASRVEQVIAPLVWRTIDGVLCRTYRYEPSGVFDAALVDGPPGTNPNGRLGAMLVAYRHLREGGVMVLDDAHRPTELRWVGNFVRLTGATLRYQGNGHGLATFRRFELKHGRRGVIEANASMFLEQGILAISRRLRR
jgi:SAM-dependent methyltransferase